MVNSSIDNSDWTVFITFDEQNYKMLYKGIDIGISRELIQDMNTNFGFLPNNLDEIFEGLYSKNISVIRDNKIDLILND
jgi:hypothetical protein